MINAKKLVAAIVVGMLSFSTVGCAMVQKTPSAISKAKVATVGKTTITKGMLDERLKPVIESLKAQYGENYAKDEQAKQTLDSEAKSMLDSMVTEEILLQKAKEKKLVPEDAQLEKEAKDQIAQIKKDRFEDDQAKFDEALKSAGYTSDSLLAEIKNQVIMNKVIDDIIKDAKVEDKEVSDYYGAHAEEFTTKPGANFAHILVKTEDEAKDIKSKIDKGAKFEDMAKQYGTDGTKDAGGDLGFIEYDTTQYDKDFMEAAKKLKENEISGPVKTQFGYHLIRATGIKSQAVVQKFDDVKESIKQQLLQGKQQQAYTTQLDNWKKELSVKTYEKNI